MPFNSQGYGNLFGGAVGEGGLGDLDTDYVRNTAVPITIGGITAGTYTPKGSIADVLDKLLYPYQNPIVSLASDIKTTVRQQGVDTIDSMILTATLTKKTGALWKVEFYKGDEFELLLPGEKPISLKAEHMYNADGEEIEDTRHAMMEIHMKLPVYAPKYSILRKYR